jgi:glycosyltransferase involved in cell wall biosynthesis
MGDAFTGIKDDMSAPLDIAVIIPCYNHARELGHTLDALARQTLLPSEVIVIDDGSSDNPSSVVTQWAGPFSVRFERFSERRGAPAARNTGAHLTNSPLLLFLDADAELVPDALDMMRRALEDHPEADFAYADFYWGKRLFSGRSFDLLSLKERNYIHTSSLLRRSAFPGFDESLKKFQDWDLWLTMAERGSKGVWIHRPLYRIEPRHEGMSRWLPKFVYWIPWARLGFQPKEVGRYKEAEGIVRNKHRI